MFRAQNFTIFKTWRQRKIAGQIRRGIVPKGVSKEEIWDALKATKPRNGAEMFGFLSAQVKKNDGTERDYGIVSVREVTSVFAKRLVDAMMTSGDVIDNFNQHKMGAGCSRDCPPCR